jgi:hypothetical protein
MATGIKCDKRQRRIVDLYELINMVRSTRTIGYPPDRVVTLSIHNGSVDSYRIAPWSTNAHL